MPAGSGTGALRVGVIGVGHMGADHAERIARRTAGAVLAGVADPDGARTVALAERLGTRSLTDPLALIDDEGVDAVVIASPGFVHEEQVLACLERGIPVLCEKPLTMDLASSLRLVEAEAATGRRLVQVGFMRRFDPEYAALKVALAGDDFGRLLLVHNIHRNASAPNVGFRSEMIVRDSLVHEVDVARFLFDEEITEITVLTPTPTSAAGDGVRDPQVAIFAMAGGGIVTNEVFVNSQVGYEVRCEAVAERGTLTAGLSSTGLSTTRAGTAGGSWGGRVPEDYRTRFARAYDLEVQAFVDAARAGTVVGPTAWDGYAATAVCEAGMESLRSGRPVPVRLAVRPDRRVGTR